MHNYKKKTTIVQPMASIFDHWSSTLDKTFDDMSCLFDDVLGTVQQGGYPPYDIERNAEGVTIISVALAGLKREDIEVFVEDNVLNIKYVKPESSVSDYDHEEAVGVDEVLDHATTKFQEKIQNKFDKVLRKGIARRSFHLKFKLHNGVQVSGGSMEDGMLRVQLKREVPESNRQEVKIQ